MGKKDNFNEAVYSMFGVGKAPTEAEAAEEVKAEAAEEDSYNDACNAKLRDIFQCFFEVKVNDDIHNGKA